MSVFALRGFTILPLFLWVIQKPPGKTTINLFESLKKSALFDQACSLLKAISCSQLLSFVNAPLLRFQTDRLRLPAIQSNERSDED